MVDPQLAPLAPIAPPALPYFVTLVAPLRVGTKQASTPQNHSIVAPPAAYRAPLLPCVEALHLEVVHVSS